MGSIRRLTLLAATLALSLGTCCTKEPATTPSDEESPPALDREAAVDDLGFTRDVLAKIEAAADAPLEPLTDWEGVMTGVQARAAEGEIKNMRESLGEELLPLGFLAFQSEMGFGMGPDKLGVVRGRDHYDILRAVQTDGANYDILNEDIIAKLKEWEKQCEFEIVGAGGDWLEGRFVKMPRNMDAFAAEVYEFCPDVVEQGAGDVHALAVEMALENSLYLWWD